MKKGLFILIGVVILSFYVIFQINSVSGEIVICDETGLTCYVNADGDGAAKDISGDDQINELDMKCYSFIDYPDYDSCPAGESNGDPNDGSFPFAYQIDSDFPILDCDDNDAAKAPYLTEVCDEKDNDCDGDTDEGLDCTSCVGDTDCESGTVDCSYYDKDGNLNNCPTTHIGYGVCNGDEQCSDYDINCICYAGECIGGGYMVITDAANECLNGDPICAPSENICGEQITYNIQTDCESAGYNWEETCEGYPLCSLFSDSETTCNGIEGCVWFSFINCFVDNDNDGYGNKSSSTPSDCHGNCAQGYVSNEDDCDDSDQYISPEATEICDDGIDNDCNSAKDCRDSGCIGNSACKPYWANDFIEYEITNKITVDYFPYSVKMIFENTGYSEGDNVSFLVYEKDSTTDDNIRTGENKISGTVDSNGRAVAIWEITESDLEAGSSDLLDEESDTYDEFEFYFTIGGQFNEDFGSNDLLFEYDLETCIGITLCSDYSQGDCNNDGCNVAEASVPEDIDCSAEGYNCYCNYDEDAGKCLAKWDGTEDDPDPEDPENPEKITIGTCIYNEEDLQDNCDDDGFLTFGWQGIWNWALGNEETQYDPENKQAECEGEGISTVICPAKTPLSFFGTWGIIVTIGVIVIVYIILHNKKHNKKKPKKRKKK